MMKTDQSHDDEKDSLELFFQKRLETSNLPYNEAQWEKMEAMLNEAKPKPLFWFRKLKLFWIWAGLIMLLLINGVLFYVNTQSFTPSESDKGQNQNTTIKNPTNQSITQKENVKKTPKNTNAIDNKQRKNSKQSKPTHDTEKLKNESNDVSKNETLEKTSGDLTESSSTNKGNTNHNKEPKAKDESSNDLTDNSGMYTPKTDHNEVQDINSPLNLTENSNVVPIDTTQYDPNEQSTQIIQSKNNRQSTIQTLPIQSIRPSGSIFTFRLPDSFNQVPVLPVQAAKDTDNQSENIVSDRPWVIGINYSTDLSTTGLNDFTRPGRKWGVNLEYMFNPRFSLQAGAQFAKVHYQATGEEYEVPYGFWGRWTNGEVPETIDATCDIVDLSINARYYWINKRRSRLFLSAGVSSYFLTRELYNYNFSGDPPPEWNSWEVQNENRNILGIANLSFGYELAINPRMSLQVEPFFKIPLGKVGFGQVNLFSSGANLHLRYHLGKR